MVLGIILPVINIDVGKAGYEQFQFLFVEDGDQFRRNDVMETCYTSAMHH